LSPFKKEEINASEIYSMVGKFAERAKIIGFENNGCLLSWIFKIKS